MRGTPSPFASPAFLLGVCLALGPGAVLAGDPPAPPAQAAVWEVFPAADFYPYYIADPIRPQGAVLVTYVAEPDIPSSGRPRFNLRLGGRYPILRRHPAGEAGTGWQLDFEGGFVGLFDIDYSLDNIGWDGLYGLMLDYKPSPALGFRIGTQHDSAHLGDEYAQRTGRERIGYTREECVAGLSWNAASHWHLYAEGGYAYAVKAFQDPWRMQAGLEYFGGTEWRRGRTHWYAALDLRAYAENDWRPRATGQIGLVIPTGSGSNNYRFALEAGAGRSVLGEFFTNDEAYAALGWYFDF